MPVSSTTCFGLPLLAFVFIVTLPMLLYNKRRKLPPGPRGFPILGNLLDVPKKESWKVYLEWGRHYSKPIVSQALKFIR